ncbi:hypothetical protein SAMN04489835_3461 [Mycolicibacterium rutilum]|uniref:Uncharacterized protein n=1 Tax=Mycolicibacterium rutilum TaxID=370526 RepID=A0A1H6KEQ3_MYCRU|nr:hypothetical protein [Mycolicibacterium rutilum]SEH73599.1 hypothetical protein SAMN04489835_3461 [Mycolicibacterium rutilum]
MTTASRTTAPAVPIERAAVRAPAATAAAGSPVDANICAAASAVCTAPSKTSSPAWKTTAVTTLTAATASTCGSVRAPVSVGAGGGSG